MAVEQIDDEDKLDNFVGFCLFVERAYNGCSIGIVRALEFHYFYYHFIVSLLVAAGETGTHLCRDNLFLLVPFGISSLKINNRKNTKMPSGGSIVRVGN